MTAPVPGPVRPDYRPRLRPEVLVSGALLHGDRTVHLIKDTGGGRSFEVGTREHFLLARMDGTRSLDDLGAAYAREYGRRLGDAHWRRLLTLLGTRGLLADAREAPDAAGTPDAPTAPDAPAPGTVRLVADADATARKLHRATGFLLAARWTVPLLLLVLAMETVAVLRLGELVDGAVALFGHPVLLTAAATLLWLSTALHELAHGVVAVHHGGRVGEIGLRWRPVPIMYCTVDDYLYLPGRRARIATAVAGAVLNLVFLLPFCALWLWAPVDGATREALAGLLFLGSLQALAMLLPLPPLDGYKIVSQAVGATGLAASSGAYLRLAVRRDPAAARYPRRARIAYTAYGLCSVLVVSALAAAVALLVVHLLDP